jgi:hypothetical protein
MDRIKLALLDYIYCTSSHLRPALDSLPSNSVSLPFGTPCTRCLGARPSSSTGRERRQLDGRRVATPALDASETGPSSSTHVDGKHVGGPPVGTLALDAYGTRACSRQLTIAISARNTSNKNPLRVK